MDDRLSITGFHHPNQHIHNTNRVQFTATIKRYPRGRLKVGLRLLPRWQRAYRTGLKKGRHPPAPNVCENGKRSLLLRSKPTKRIEPVSTICVTDGHPRRLVSSAATHPKLDGRMISVEPRSKGVKTTLATPVTTIILQRLLITHQPTRSFLKVTSWDNRPRLLLPIRVTLLRHRKRNVHAQQNSLRHLALHLPTPNLNEQQGKWTWTRTMMTVGKMIRRQLALRTVRHRETPQLMPRHLHPPPLVSMVTHQAHR